MRAEQILRELKAMGPMLRDNHLDRRPTGLTRYSPTTGNPETTPLTRQEVLIIELAGVLKGWEMTDADKAYLDHRRARQQAPASIISDLMLGSKVSAFGSALTEALLPARLSDGTTQSGCHDEVLPRALDAQYRFLGVAVELHVQPKDEIDGCRFRQPPLRRHPVDLCLNPDMGGGLDLQVASLLVLAEAARQSAFDVPRPRIVPFDEVTVVGVHDPHEICQIGGRARM